jgi:hypothetical protein
MCGTAARAHEHMQAVCGHNAAEGATSAEASTWLCGPVHVVLPEVGSFNTILATSVTG